MPWWLLPTVLALLATAGGARLLLQGRRIARRGDPTLAVRGASLTVLGIRVLISGLTLAALAGMLAYGLR